MYKIDPKSEQTLETLADTESILSIWSSKNGITKGTWSIIGNIPVNDEFKLPDFWKMDAFNPNRIILVKGEHAFEVTEKENSYEVSKEKIRNAQPYGIFGEEAVKIRYKFETKIQGLV
ncbi:immunity 26/phosphotriesterase HocA family protein [Rossellomorea vietnamensis]|uniref:Imm26 family immunity protein n=1 Tax=Rossellomorea vietnamensis TaxID=218284 RepID=UPI001CCCE29D|nr:Imm26 family immunity protein [Rossellomorea vietnamensis]MCA0151121.1 immunity 26/phosphotriesterase HocA family protein [Rossellomorea vietnamensis]